MVVSFHTMKMVVFMVMLVVMMQENMGEECLPTPTTWNVSLISYQEATVSISWHTGSIFCMDTVMVSQATDKEETISHPIKVSEGQAMLQLEDKCKLYTIRLAVLLPGRNEVRLMSSFSPAHALPPSWCTPPVGWSGSPPCSPPSLSCQTWPSSPSPPTVRYPT